jgi:hypothetical protein
LTQSERVDVYDLDPNHPGGLRGNQCDVAHSDAPPSRGPDGLIRIWLDPKVAAELGRARGPGESYSDVILRLAAEGV